MTVSAKISANSLCVQQQQQHNTKKHEFVSMAIIIKKEQQYDIQSILHIRTYILFYYHDDVTHQKRHLLAIAGQKNA